MNQLSHVSEVAQAAQAAALLLDCLLPYTVVRNPADQFGKSPDPPQSTIFFVLHLDNWTWLACPQHRPLMNQLSQA